MKTHHKLMFGLLLICCSQLCYSQKRNNIWCFGDSSGIDFNNLNNPVPFQSCMDSRGSCASIADSNGSLLFYTSDPYKPTYFSGAIRLGAVYTNLHTLMMNGDSLVGRGWYNECIIIPDLVNNSLFYVFNAGVADLLQKDSLPGQSNRYVN